MMCGVERLGTADVGDHVMTFFSDLIGQQSTDFDSLVTTTTVVKSDARNPNTAGRSSFVIQASNAVVVVYCTCTHTHTHACMHAHTHTQY